MKKNLKKQIGATGFFFERITNKWGAANLKKDFEEKKTLKIIDVEILSLKFDAYLIKYPEGLYEIAFYNIALPSEWLDGFFEFLNKNWQKPDRAIDLSFSLLPASLLSESQLPGPTIIQKEMQWFKGNSYLQVHVGGIDNHSNKNYAETKKIVVIK